MTSGIVARLSTLAIVAAATIAPSRPSVLTTHVVVERYADGAIRRESTYRGDVLDGPSRGWYADGAPMFVYSYRNGVSEGVQRQWYPSGQIYTLFHHRAGHEDGQQQMWNADGTIRSNYVIRDGKRFGLVGAMGCTGKGTPASGEMQ